MLPCGKSELEPGRLKTATLNSMANYEWKPTIPPMTWKNLIGLLTHLYNSVVICE